ncbi:acido-empty-quinoprotein group A [Terriglobus sp. ADX1]|uniref:acido-empty-quinoprotein group A n=1 Tax=Terriglobus sp. ADX1 TaxID=2794063 RepID=UPI002FE53F94
MRIVRKIQCAAALCAAMTMMTTALQAQWLDPKDILKPKPDSWPSYSGDYSGRRYSPLTEINSLNVKGLTLAWAQRLTGGEGGPGGGGPPGFGAAAVPTNVGGVGTAVAPMGTIKGSILQVDGYLYVSTPDNVWAMDAMDGHVLWHFLWKTRGGTHIGNRGVAMWHDRLFLETPDDYLVAIDAKTGKEIWHKEIASFDLQYFSTMAPVVIGDHLLVGTGNDLDEPGMLQSFNPQTGDVEWKWFAVPMKKDDPGIETWRNLDAASHGGGNVWVNGSYDPETHLYILGTGNPTAAYTSQMRGPGANLYTCATVAINVDTGKMAWYYQTSPHDTHDFDSAQTQVLVDGMFKGKPRKMVMTAARNGYFFVLDRTTGEHLLTSKLVDSPNWAEDKLDKNGAPVRIPAKDFDYGGALVSPANGGVVNWPPPAFSPQTGLFYVNANESYAMYYLATTDPRGAMGLGGKDEVGLGTLGTYLIGMDYKTGKPAWKHRYPGVGGGSLIGVMATAGHLLFSGDQHGNLVAYESATGKQLWHARIGVSNAPETYMLDGHQYVLAGAGDMVYAFRLQ